MKYSEMKMSMVATLWQANYKIMIIEGNIPWLRTQLLAKCFSCKHEKLSSIPRTHDTKARWVALTCNPSPKEADR